MTGTPHRPAPRAARVRAISGSLVALGLLAAGCSPPEQEEVESLPEVTLETFEAPGRQQGEGDPEVYLPDLQGPAVVNLWASWCGPCRTELPVLEEFAREHGDRVRVLGVNYLESQPEEAVALARSNELSYQLLQDPDGELDGSAPFPALRGLPFWAVVDADGRVVHREFVELTSEQEIADLVEEHLGMRL